MYELPKIRMVPKCPAPSIELRSPLASVSDRLLIISALCSNLEHLRLTRQGGDAN